ncbi:MAG: MBL fold metallo-hydrolase [Elusimicrobiota bacterium]
MRKLILISIGIIIIISSVLLLHAMAKYSDVQIYSCGHAGFLIKSSDGTRILMDPFDTSIGYEAPYIISDIVTISNSRPEHSSLTWAHGRPQIIKELGPHKYKSIIIQGFQSFVNDSETALKKKQNIMYIIETDGLRILHCGALGETLTDRQYKKLGDIDILIIPVGGLYMLSPKEAIDVVNKINPKIIIPMAYKTKECNLKLEDVSEFLRGFDKVEFVNYLEIGAKEVKKLKGVYLLGSILNEPYYRRKKSED